MLQFITNYDDPEVVLSQAKAVLDGGCKWIQLRMKNSARDIVISTAQRLKPLCAEKECILIIDDYVDIAKELQLDGVHLGKSDMNPVDARRELGMQAIIGATANTFEDICKLVLMDIDYIGLGPFRFTSTKKNLSPILGLDGYNSIMNKCRETGYKIPIVAIGGIKHDDITALMNTGVSGIALSGSIISAQNPTEETTKIISLLQDIINERINQLYSK